MLLTHWRKSPIIATRKQAGVIGMSDYKYTDDGKKVAVIGKLNAEQTIVQEVFVSQGQEFPSGENFVVKSLHDKPAESWKAKSLRELEA